MTQAFEVEGCILGHQGRFSGMVWPQGGEKLSDEATGVMLEKVIRLLSYLSDKDLFGEFYRKRLSSRLLAEKSSVEHHELAVLAQLKQQCGAQFTGKVRVAYSILPCYCLTLPIGQARELGQLDA